MKTPLDQKSTVDTIRKRFDVDVERFSRLETGQQATIDAPLVLDLVSACCSRHVRAGGAILDIGCGAGNFTLKVMQAVGVLDCHLMDLSAPMLDRAVQRVAEAGASAVHTYQSDMREVDFPEGSFDVIVAGAVMHHLRGDEEWEGMFEKIWKWLKVGGRFYVSDLVTFDDSATNAVMWERYGEYLEGLGGVEYRKKVLRYIDEEDSPRSQPYQINCLRKAGFRSYDVLHKNSVFACYYAEK